MAWYPILGGAVFWISLLGSIIVYAISKKWSTIFYIMAIALYIYTVGYFIDTAELSSDVTFLVLLVSAGVMLLVGWYLTKRLRKPKQEAKTA